MDSTSVSLLERLRKPTEQDAWGRFVDLYAPLIYHWGRSQGLSATDASDLVGEVMSILVGKLPDFTYDPAKRFRGWLRTITVNAARNIHRQKAALPVTGVDAVIQSVSVADGTDLFNETEYRGFLARRALRLMQAEFSERTWKSCWQHVAEGRRASDVAKEFGITTNAVYIAKSRIMRRLRQELQGLLS